MVVWFTSTTLSRLIVFASFRSTSSSFHVNEQHVHPPNLFSGVIDLPRNRINRERPPNVNCFRLSLLQYDAKGTLAGIFSQILTGDEATRSSCFKFVQTKIRNLGTEVVTKEIEEFMISEIKKILQVNDIEPVEHSIHY